MCYEGVHLDIIRLLYFRSEPVTIQTDDPTQPTVVRTNSSNTVTKHPRAAALTFTFAAPPWTTDLHDC